MQDFLRYERTGDSHVMPSYSQDFNKPGPSKIEAPSLIPWSEENDSEMDTDVNPRYQPFYKGDTVQKKKGLVGMEKRLHNKTTAYNSWDSD